MSDFASVDPSTITFVEHERELDCKVIRITNNRSDVPLAYKIRVSVQQVFIIPSFEGYIFPNQHADVEVTMKPLNQFPDIDMSHAKFAVEVCVVPSSDNGMEIREFVKKHEGKFTRHAVFCEVQRLSGGGLGNQNTHANRSHGSIANKGLAANKSAEPLSVSTQLRTSMSIENDDAVSGEGGNALNDTMRMVYRDAARFIMEEEKQQVNASTVLQNKAIGPRGRVLELMVKNVGKDCPLLPAEVEELKGIRLTLSKAQWAEWLSIAREEKRRRQSGVAATAPALRTASVRSNMRTLNTHPYQPSVTPEPLTSRHTTDKVSSAMPDGSNIHHHNDDAPMGKSRLGGEDVSLEDAYQEATLRAAISATTCSTPSDAYYCESPRGHSPITIHKHSPTTSHPSASILSNDLKSESVIRSQSNFPREFYPQNGSRDASKRIPPSSSPGHLQHNITIQTNAPMSSAHLEQPSTKLSPMRPVSPTKMMQYSNSEASYRPSMMRPQMTVSLITNRISSPISDKRSNTSNEDQFKHTHLHVPSNVVQSNVSSSLDLSEISSRVNVSEHDHQVRDMSGRNVVSTRPQAAPKMRPGVAATLNGPACQNASFQSASRMDATIMDTPVSKDVPSSPSKINAASSLQLNLPSPQTVGTSGTSKPVEITDDRSSVSLSSYVRASDRPMSSGHLGKEGSLGVTARNSVAPAERLSTDIPVPSSYNPFQSREAQPLPASPTSSFKRDAIAPTLSARSGPPATPSLTLPGRVSLISSPPAPTPKESVADTHPPNPPAATNLPAELAKSSARRIDSAYSAAHTLMQNLQADLNHGSNIYRTPSENKSVETKKTLSVLESMMSSLQESKNSLNRISSLDVVPEIPPAPPLVSRAPAATLDQTPSTPAVELPPTRDIHSDAARLEIEQEKKRLEEQRQKQEWQQVQIDRQLQEQQMDMFRRQQQKEQEQLSESDTGGGGELVVSSNDGVAGRRHGNANDGWTPVDLVTQPTPANVLQRGEDHSRSNEMRNSATYTEKPHRPRSPSSTFGNQRKFVVESVSSNKVIPLQERYHDVHDVDVDMDEMDNRGTEVDVQWSRVDDNRGDRDVTNKRYRQPQPQDGVGDMYDDEMVSVTALASPGKMRSEGLYQSTPTAPIIHDGERSPNTTRVHDNMQPLKATNNSNGPFVIPSSFSGSGNVKPSGRYVIGSGRQKMNTNLGRSSLKSHVDANNDYSDIEESQKLRVFHDFPTKEEKLQQRQQFEQQQYLNCNEKFAETSMLSTDLALASSPEGIKNLYTGNNNVLSRVHSQYENDRNAFNNGMDEERFDNPDLSYVPRNMQQPRDRSVESMEVANGSMQRFRTSQGSALDGSEAILSPQKSRMLGESKRQPSTSFSGYMYDGVRYDKGQGRLARLCLAQGPLVQAHEDFPIRVDADNNVVDVVWREQTMVRQHPNYSKNTASSASRGGGVTTSSNTLRRERFSFDDIFAGPQAADRLSVYARLRTRQALIAQRNLTFMCVATGEGDASRHQCILEPPVAVVLGDGGGRGLVSTVVEELFRSQPRVTQQVASSTRQYQRGYSPEPSAYNGDSNTTITLSAVLLVNGVIVDLLGGGNDGKQQNIGKIVSRKENLPGGGTKSRIVMTGVSRVQMNKPSDFERIVGVLLGRRSAMKELTPMMGYMAAEMPDAPWLLPDKAASLLLTVAVNGRAATRQTKDHTSFTFVCPSGQHWSQPGPDICMVAEALSCLPHDPPPNLLRSSPVTHLLMDPGQLTDYVTVASVSRQFDQDKRSTQTNHHIVQSALLSFRVIAQLTGIY